MNILLLKETRLIHFGSSLHTLISHIRHVNKVFNILRRLGFLIDANRWVTLIILNWVRLYHILKLALASQFQELFIWLWLDNGRCSGWFFGFFAGIYEIILIKLLIVHPLNCKLDVMDHVLEEARLLIIEALQLPERIFYLVNRHVSADHRLNELQGPLVIDLPLKHSL